MGLFDQIAIANGQNVKVGRGAVFFDRQTTPGTSRGYVDMGSCDAVEIGGQVDTVEKRGMVDDTNPIISTVERSRTFDINITFAEWLKQNLELMLLSTAGEYTQPATPVVGENLSASTIKGRSYFTAKKNLTAVTVKDDGVAAALNTDYQLDTTNGVVKVLSTGSIADASVLTIDYTPVAITAGSGFPDIAIGTAGSIIGAFRFVGKPLAGKVDELWIPKVQVFPAGVLALISEDYQSAQLRMRILSDAANNPSYPFGWHRQR